MYLLAQAFCCPDFQLDPQHLQMETWGTNDVPSIHSAAPAASNLMPKRNTMIENTTFKLLFRFYSSYQLEKNPLWFNKKVIILLSRQPANAALQECIS